LDLNEETLSRLRREGRAVDIEQHDAGVTG
jgi:hypothetical protein